MARTPSGPSLQRCKRITAAVAAVALTALAGPSVAFGGTYSVSSCRFGWSPDVHVAPGEDPQLAYDYCDLPEHGLEAAFFSVSGRVAVGDSAGWRFDAPPDTAISGTTIRWTGTGDYAAGDWGAVEAKVDSSTTTGPGHFDAFDITKSLRAVDADWVRVSLTCVPSTQASCRTLLSDEPADAPRFFVKAATVNLVDRLAPVVQSVAGSALSESTWTGNEPIAFSASDKGGGVYRVIVDLDGNAAAALPATGDDRCIDQGSDRTFAYPIPCPVQASGTVSIDARSLPAGRHTVAVYLEDAAGNRTALIPPGPRTIVNDLRSTGYFVDGRFFNPRFASPRTLNGDRATDGARPTAAFVRTVGKGRSRHTVQRRAREVRFSQRATVRGTLTAPSGEPIRGATVFVGQKREGEHWRLYGAARTNSRGAFVYRSAARQPSRQLCFVYFPFSDSHENVRSGALQLGVRAGMTLRVNRGRLHNGDRLIFTGRVLGPLPPTGIAVTLQAKVGRNFRSFRQLRATSRTGGRIRTVYRFERTNRPVRYHFRLKVVRQAGLPFLSGVSPVISVAVRP